MGRPVKTIIFSHGFGVRADSRGMFPELAAALPGYHSIMFDYNELLPGGDTVVAPLTRQAQKLQQAIDSTPEGEIILIAHSQGAIVASMVDYSKVTKVILLAPPVAASMQRVVKMIAQRPGSLLDLSGISKLPRADGSTTYFPKEYLQSIDEVDPMQLYQRLASILPVIIVKATNDEMLGDTTVDEIIGAELVPIAADHNFTGSARAKLVKALQNILETA